MGTLLSDAHKKASPSPPLFPSTHRRGLSSRDRYSLSGSYRYSLSGGHGHSLSGGHGYSLSCSRHRDSLSSRDGHGLSGGHGNSLSGGHGHSLSCSRHRYSLSCGHGHSLSCRNRYSLSCSRDRGRGGRHRLGGGGVDGLAHGEAREGRRVRGVGLECGGSSCEARTYIFGFIEECESMLELEDSYTVIALLDLDHHNVRTTSTYTVYMYVYDDCDDGISRSGRNATLCTLHNLTIPLHNTTSMCSWGLASSFPLTLTTPTRP